MLAQAKCQFVGEVTCKHIEHFKGFLCLQNYEGLRANLGGTACGRTSIFTSNGKDWLKPKIGDARLTVGLSAVLAGCSAPSRKRNPRSKWRSFAPGWKSRASAR
eukprot:152360-Amphidinium_carterae.1